MKRIILLSDGTGNTPNKVWRSNVWRVFQSLDRTSAEQHPIYDDGVGTSSFLPFALIGGMFGWGLKRNVISLYKFAARNYETKADEIFAFGFSRGAFTINTVINLIAHQGLIEYRSEADCDWRAKAAYRAYRRARAKSLLRLEYIVYAIRDFVIAPLLWRGRQYSKDDNRQGVRIKFVGLWDTVGAYGLPVESMTRAISKWYWPLDLPNRELPEIVDRACHALSLDDERRTFHPILWNERNESVKAGQGGKRYIQDERISQVWFAGSHANVGGGYPDDSLAHVSLCWMLEEAGKCGLKFNKAPKADPDTEKNFRSIEDKDGRVYDSRKGIRGYYRYAPRKLIELTHMRFSSQPGDEVEIDRPKIHESVFDRIFRKVHFYGPIGIPATYRIVGYDGQITQHQEKYEGEEKAKERAKQQERVWDLVWIRSVLNYTIMGALLYVALYPLLTRFSPEDEYSSPLRPISDLVRLAGAFLPDAFTIWVNAYARSPGFFFVLMVVIFIMYRVNSTTKVKITDEMCDLWLGGAREYTPGLLHTLRTSPIYIAIKQILVKHIWPNIFAIIFALVLCWLVALVANRFFLAFEDAGGMICKETGKASPLQPGESAVIPEFKASSVCQSTGVELERNARYLIRSEVITPFRERGIDASRGFYSTEPAMLHRKAWNIITHPFRRVLSRPWFSVIARIGEKGAEEILLDPPDPGTGKIDELIRATRDGELFLYVNDAIVAIPGLYGLFYKNNEGSAKVVITRRR